MPILVVCRPEDTLAADYRRAGAAACLNPPIDLMQMKEALGLPDASPDAFNGRGMAPLFVSAAAEGIRFAGYVLRPRDNRLIGPDDTEVALSAIETRVLQHLAETPGIVWPAAAIAEAAQGAEAGRAEAGARRQSRPHGRSCDRPAAQEAGAARRRRGAAPDQDPDRPRVYACRRGRSRLGPR